MLLLPACGAETSKARSEKVGMRGTFHALDSRRVPLTRRATRVDLSPQAAIRCTHLLVIGQHRQKNASLFNDRRPTTAFKAFPKLGVI